MEATPKKILFKEGIPGFEYLKEFEILEDENKEFYYLQSIQQPAIAFIIVDPYTLKPNYAPNIHKSYFEKLGTEKSTDLVVFVIATIGKSMEDTTVNLQAPLLIHIEKRLGVQAILEGKEYQSKHKITDLLNERSEGHVSPN